jgi:hypothetical protein
VFLSGCHSFWRNDLLKLICHLSAGVILLGAMRHRGKMILRFPRIVRVLGT